MPSPFIGESSEEASLYLAQFDDGTIKVGYSNNPRARLATVEYIAQKKFGASMVRWHVFAHVGACVRLQPGEYPRRAARVMERLCIDRFTAIATVRGPGREFFLGLDFDTAMSHIEAVIQEKQA